MPPQPQGSQGRSTRIISIVSLVIAALSLALAGYGAWQATVEAQKADARATGAVVRYFIKWTGAYEDGVPAPTMPGTALNVFQLTNTGRSTTSIVGVEAQSGDHRAATFRQVGGDGRQLTGWNDSILIEGGATVTVAAYTFVWPNVCDESTLASCPKMTVLLGDGGRVDLRSYLTDSDCEKSTMSIELCQRESLVGHTVTNHLQESKAFCKLTVAEVDTRELAHDPNWKPAGSEGAEEICTGRTIDY